MKKVFLSGMGAVLLLATMLVSADTVPLGTNEANVKMELTWDLNPPADAVAFYTVYLSHTNEASAFRTNSVVAPPMALTNMMFSLTNGVYRFEVTATGKSSLESDPSVPLVFFWYGNTPGRPANPGSRFFK